jgi:hypothetical protein
MIGTSLDRIKGAPRSEVMIYMPYYAKNQQEILPMAITLYKRGSLEGERVIEGGDNIPFVVTWILSKLPSDITNCTVQFNGQADLSYQSSMSNSDLIKYLIYVLENYKNSKTIDFNQEFYRNLLNIET